MEILNMALKREGSVLVGSNPIFWFNCVNVLSVAFTSFTFVVTLAFICVNASSFLTFLVILLSLSRFCVLCWQ